MISRNFGNNLLFKQKIHLGFRFKTERAIDIAKLEQETASLEITDEDIVAREEEIERKRNKSRLKPHHYNILHGKVPHTEPKVWYHGTLKYARKMYGQYGECSGVDPSLCWPIKEELIDKMEYERVAYPFTIPEMIKTAREKREGKERDIQLQQQEIVEKMKKLDKWKADLKNKIAKKEAEALAAKEAKQKLVEEVRRHFGYTIDPRDEKFKEMLEKKEKEQKKSLKDARKKAKEEKLLAMLLNKQDESSKSETEKK